MQMPIVSVGCTPKKADSRCRAWRQILSHAAVSSLRVAVVSGADSLGGRYETFGREVEVFAGDFIFGGEATEAIDAKGHLRSLAKRGDFPVEDLKGAGEVAALVRYAQATVRLPSKGPVRC